MDISKLNDEQQKAVLTTEGPVLILAGAGSGKTSCLTYRLANLIEKGIDPSNILLLTFTNKAANEMTERAKKILKDEDLNISGMTYHSFCAEILRHYADFLGFDFNFTVCDESDASEILNLIKENNKFDKNLGLPKGKQLISMFSYIINKDKTLEYVLENRYPNFAHLQSEIEKIKQDYLEYKFNHNILDYDDLLVQVINLFEAYPAVCKKYSDLYKYIMVDEYQDSNLLQMKLLKLLRQYDNKNICVVGDPEQCLVKGTKINTKAGKKNIEDIIEDDLIEVAVGNGIVEYKKPDIIKAKKINDTIYKITTKKGKEIKATGEHVIFAYSEKVSNGKRNKQEIYIDFELFYNGRSRLSIECFDNNTEEIVKQYTNYKLIFDEGDRLIELIDEIKDNYPYVVDSRYARLIRGISYKFMLIKNLSINDKVIINNNGILEEDIIIDIQKEIYNDYVYDINIKKFRNYFANDICVHNCIYGFRGSNHDNILNFADDFDDCEVIKLNKNYRSNQEILDLSNSILTTTGAFKNDLVGTYEIGYKPKLVTINSQNDEAHYVLNKILKYKREGVSLNDMAVLIRGSNDSNMLEALIAEYSGNLEYQKFGGIKFLEREFVKNILSYLKILINVKDEIAWFRILKLYPSIGSVNAKKITEKIMENGLDELLDKSYEKKKYGEYLPEIYNFFIELNKLDFIDQIEKLVNDYYYKTIKRSIKNMKTKESTKNQKLRELDQNIEEAQVLITLANDYENANKFINSLTLDASTTAAEIKDCLTISTIHSAKGLEWKVVFILNCVEGTFPWRKQLLAPTLEAEKELEEELEEEKRVFYVAITRAKEDLYLTFPQYNIFSRELNELSSFLTDGFIYNDKCECIEL